MNINGLFLELNENDHTAVISHSPEAKGEVFVSRSYSGYDVVSIKKNAFRKNHKIESIKFAENSKLRKIGKKAFYGSSIKSISFPSSLEELENGWSTEALYLDTIFISPKNNFFSSLDEKLILRKSVNSEPIDYDTIVYCKKNVENITVPSFIKYISGYAFEGCENLEKIVFSESSQLLSIGKEAFLFTNIQSLSIPNSVEYLEDGWCGYTPNLTNVIIQPSNTNFKYLDDKHKVILSKYIIKINDYAFFKCLYLEDFIIPNNSELFSIGSNSFSGTQITELLFPQHLEELKESWCYYTPNIYNIIISPYNKNFKFYDKKHAIVLGKSNKDDDTFDSIVLVNRSVITITIPSFIKYLCSCSLSSCQELKKIKFQKNSQLISIGSNAFSSSFFKYISIPYSTNIIGKEAFSHCYVIKSIEFLGENMIIGEKCFELCSNLMLISFPNAQKIKFNDVVFNDVFESLSIFTNTNAEFI